MILALTPLAISESKPAVRRKPLCSAKSRVRGERESVVPTNPEFLLPTCQPRVSSPGSPSSLTSSSSLNVRAMKPLLPSLVWFRVSSTPIDIPGLVLVMAGARLRAISKVKFESS